jgi:hypothetical protein
MEKPDKTVKSGTTTTTPLAPVKPTTLPVSNPMPIKPINCVIKDIPN